MPYIASMGIYVVSKNVMLDLLREKFPGANDFGSEVIPGATSIGLRVCVPSICLILRRLVIFIYLLRILFMFMYIHRCKLTCMMATGKTLVQLRLSIMQIWESPKSLCLTSGELYRPFNIEKCT